MIYPLGTAVGLGSVRIDHAAEAEHAAAILARGHEQIFAVLVELVGLRKIPVRMLRLVGTAAAEDRRAGMLVVELVGPLPDVAD